jgi:ketosteroid isomerase-like protein
VSPRPKLDVIDEMYALSTSDDIEAMVALLAPGFELDVTSYVFNPAVWHGEEGAREWLRQAREVWDTPHYDIEQIHELDDKRAIAVVTLKGKARQSGIEVELRQTHLWTIRDGLVVRLAHFNEEEQAWRAAGVSPPSS